MRILADECCDGDVVVNLRRAGHDVAYVAEDMPGAGDADVLGCAWREDRLLLTEDKGFGELAVRLNFQTHGVILLRFSPQDLDSKLRRAVEVLAAHGDRCRGHIIVISRSKARIRRLRP